MTRHADLAEAIIVATRYHRTQQDLAGQPFVGHPLRVLAYTALTTTDPSVLCAAVLHDVVEDTACTLRDLEGMGFNERVIELVDALTRDEEVETYNEYIERVEAAGLDAITIKLADLQDNLDQRRGEFEGRDSIDARHLRAFQKLTKSRRVVCLTPHPGHVGPQAVAT